MWDYFNVTLFGGALRWMFLNFSRRAKSLGFFTPERWESGKGSEATPAVPASRLGSGRRDHDARLCGTKMRAPFARGLAPRALPGPLPQRPRRLWSFQTAKALAPGPCRAP